MYVPYVRACTIHVIQFFFVYFWSIGGSYFILILMGFGVFLFFVAWIASFGAHFGFEARGFFLRYRPVLGMVWERHIGMGTASILWIDHWYDMIMGNWEIWEWIWVWEIWDLGYIYM